MYQLSQITVANGYHSNLGSGTLFEDFPEDAYAITSFPSVAVLFGNDTRSHYDNELLYVTQKVTLVAFTNPASGTVQLDAEKIKQDIQKMLGTRAGLPESGGGITCQLAMYASAEPFGRVLDEPQASWLRGVKLGVDVTYQQTFADPTVS